MRSMKLTVGQRTLYESRFDPKSGTLVRTTEKLGRYGEARSIPNWRKIQDQLRERFPHRYACIPSPSPELIDVSITDRCSFGCSYCLAPETPVMGADLAWRPISEVTEGDVLAGFDEFSTLRQHRKLKPAIVEAVCVTRRPALRIITETREVLTTANHGWLRKDNSRHLWRAASELKVGHALSFFGDPYVSPEISEDYRRGYLAGVSLGDGTFRFEPGWKNWTHGFPQSYWRVALKDEEALGRIVAYLAFFGVASEVRPFNAGSRTTTPMQKVEVRSIPKLETIHSLVRQPVDSAEFRRGWLAGFFDAEGSHDGNLRYSQKALGPLHQVIDFAKKWGFHFDLEPPAENGVSKTRLRGSVYDRMRFLGTIRPAIGRKTTDWLGTALETRADRIVAIESAGEIDVVDIQTSAATFFASGLATHNCYQDSTPKGEHASPELVPTLIKGLDHAPYQIAIGGGEPTGHPEFAGILKEVRRLGTVPNYTTAGHIFKQPIIDATNLFCGGVAITYHRFRGLDWFKTTYRQWAEALKCQLHIHVIADKDVARSLDELAVFQSEIKRKLNVVLLAYYPDVGRASMDMLMTRRVYTNDLPVSIRNAIHRGVGIAFSEGLLPYFLSRPEIGINTDFAVRTEGIYSCYVDPRGFMWQTSFHAPREKNDDESIFQKGSQQLWNELRAYSGGPGGEECYDCPMQTRCSTPHQFHYLTCAKASHNRLPLKVLPTEGERRGRFDFLSEDDED
jgi:MoaA/NifB/PqqE/SkfB family radical SAM enzyme